MKKIDCTGMACPAPVLKAKEIIEKENPTTITVTVDNEAARQNVTRFLESRNFSISVEAEGNNFHVTGKAGDSPARPSHDTGKSVEVEEGKIMVMITSNRMGHGDDELGVKLMVSFLKTLKEMGDVLWRLVFVNNGVKLTIQGSEILPVLKEYEEKGLHIMVCGTCLTHFDLLDKKEVGETTNMLDIVTAMQLADKVINL